MRGGLKFSPSPVPNRFPDRNKCIWDFPEPCVGRKNNLGTVGLFLMISSENLLCTDSNQENWKWIFCNIQFL